MRPRGARREGEKQFPSSLPFFPTALGNQIYIFFDAPSACLHGSLLYLDLSLSVQMGGKAANHFPSSVHPIRSDPSICDVCVEGRGQKSGEMETARETTPDDIGISCIFRHQRVRAQTHRTRGSFLLLSDARPIQFDPISLRGTYMRERERERESSRASQVGKREGEEGRSLSCKQ